MCVKSRKLVFIANSDRLSAASSGLGFDIRLMELHWATFACGSISQSIVYRSNFSKLIHFVSKSPTTHIHHCNITPKTRGCTRLPEVILEPTIIGRKTPLRHSYQTYVKFMNQFGTIQSETAVTRAKTQSAPRFGEIK